MKMNEFFIRKLKRTDGNTENQQLLGKAASISEPTRKQLEPNPSAEREKTAAESGSEEKKALPNEDEVVMDGFTFETNAKIDTRYALYAITFKPGVVPLINVIAEFDKHLDEAGRTGNSNPYGTEINETIRAMRASFDPVECKPLNDNMPRLREKLRKQLWTYPLFAKIILDENDDPKLTKTLTSTHVGGYLLTVDGILKQAAKRKMPEFMQLYWAVDSNGMLTIDPDWWDMERIDPTGSLTPGHLNRILHPTTASFSPEETVILLYTDIEHLKKSNDGGTEPYAIAVYSFGDVLNLAKQRPDLVGCILNLNTDLHLFYEL